MLRGHSPPEQGTANCSVHLKSGWEKKGIGNEEIRVQRRDYVQSMRERKNVHEERSGLKTTRGGGEGVQKNPIKRGAATTDIYGDKGGWREVAQDPTTDS